MAEQSRPIKGDHPYEQEIKSPDEQEQYPGKSLITTNHAVIRRWAEDRGATPATVPGTEHEGRPGVLRFDFPGYGGESLQHISWEEWFTSFEDRELNFIFQQHRKDERPSNFFRLDNPYREQA